MIAPAIAVRYYTSNIITACVKHLSRYWDVLSNWAYST